MTFHTCKHLHDELIQLLNVQLNSLEKEISGVATVSDVLSYEFRQKRIAELYRDLLRKQAAEQSREKLRA